MMNELVERRGARIPCAMATQHPDSASRYVPVQEEEAEALQCLAPPQDGGLGCDEYMVDYEGKMTPYHQVARIACMVLDKLHLVPGRDVFITPRISSAEQETVFRQYASILAAIEANYCTRDVGPSVLEVIHPMTTTGTELVEVRRRITVMEKIEVLEVGTLPREIDLIPLFEGVPQQLSIRQLLDEYVRECRSKINIQVPYLRVFIGKSDSALMYGHVASAMACKLAIADAYAFGAENGIPVAPIFGGGALPFRGHVTLENIHNVLREYAGVRTITVQSGIRYDHGAEKTRELVRTLHQELPKRHPLVYAEEQRQHMLFICGVFAKHYIQTLLRIAPVARQLSDILPQQRDRLIHRGMIGYARRGPQTRELAELCKPLTGGTELARELIQLEVGDLRLPRAITYTGSLYTVCLPPEFIGTGRGLLELSQKNKDAFEALLKEYYPSLPVDLKFAGRFLDLERARRFLPQEVIQDITEDINLIRELLDLEFEPDPDYGSLVDVIEPYLNIMRGMLERSPAMESPKLDPLAYDLLIKLGKMRGSLG